MDDDRKTAMTLPRARFGLVGTGWRADFYLRLARALPELFEVTAVSTRDPGRAEAIQARWSVPTVHSAEELLERFKPDFVVASVNRVAAPDVIRDVTQGGVPLLSETPPAVDADAMDELWASLPHPELVQVAEQYPYLPRFAAYRTLLAAGRLGEVTSAQVSWTHGYHGVALLRMLLGAGMRDATVRATAFETQISRSLERDGWPEEASTVRVTQTIATLDFVDRMGLYDFTDGQWFHPLMRRRVQVRGTDGEIVDDAVTRLVDPHTPLRQSLVRRQTGIDGDLEGFDLDTIALGDEVLYRNPLPAARLSDEEIAIGTVMMRMHAWVRGESPPPYPLAEACQDHRLALAIRESAETGAPVHVGPQAWAAT
jgi:predicted dehydrogenase